MTKPVIIKLPPDLVFELERLIEKYEFELELEELVIFSIRLLIFREEHYRIYTRKKRKYLTPTQKEQKSVRDFVYKWFV